MDYIAFLKELENPSGMQEQDKHDSTLSNDSKMTPLLLSLKEKKVKPSKKKKILFEPSVSKSNTVDSPKSKKKKKSKVSTNNASPVLNIRISKQSSSQSIQNEKDAT